MSSAASRRRIAVNLAANYGQLGLMAAVTLFLLPLYLHLLGPAQWGVLALCLTVYGLLFGLDLLLAPPMLRDIAAARGEAPAVFRAYLRVYVGLAVPVSIFGQAAVGWLGGAEALKGALRLVLLQWLFQFCNSAALGYWNGLQRQGEANLRMAAALLLKHALALLLITQWQASALAYLLPFVVVGLVELVVNQRAVRAEAGTQCEAAPPALARTLGAYAVAAVLGLLTGQIDRLVLALALPAADYGRYFLASTLILSLLQLQMPVQRAFLPRLAMAAAPRQEVLAMLRVSLLLVVLPCLVLALFPQWALQLWLHDTATAAALEAPLRLMLCGVAALALYAPFGTLLLSQRCNRLLVRINGLALLAQLIILLGLAPRLGLVAGAWAWLACGLVQLCFVPWIWRARVETSHA